MPQFNVKAKLKLRRWIIGIGFTGFFPASPYLTSSEMKSFVSRSRCGTYVWIEGLFKADAAPFLRLFRDSLYGDVPMVVPAVFDRICGNAES